MAWWTFGLAPFFHIVLQPIMSFIYRAQPEGIPNLRQYMKECRLPSLLYTKEDTFLPPAGHVSHKNHLSVRPETYRRLESIYGIDDSIWLALEQCLDTHIPSSGFTPNQRNLVSGHGLTVPTSIQDAYPWNLDKRPDHIHRFIPWLDRLPFTTVKSLLHLSMPETREWSFTPAVNIHPEPDSDIFCYYTWSPMKRQHNTRSDPAFLKAADGRRLLVAMQPPWILTARDLNDFADSRSFPPFLLPGHGFPEALENAEDRLWAKVWDSCVRENIYYFVVTSYTHWVFGVFTRGYTTAFTSSVLEFNSTTPTIVEMLSYWVISAMGFSGGHDNEVPEARYQNSMKIHPPRRPHQCADPEDSESDWGGSSIDSYHGSAGVRARSVYTCTDGGVAERTMYSPDVKQQFRAVEEWVAQMNSIASSDMSMQDVETLEGYAEPEEEFPFVVEIYFNCYRDKEGAHHVGQWLH